MDKKTKPIRMNYSALRDYVYNGYVKNSLNAYIAKDYAVLRTFHGLQGFVFSLGKPYRLDELRIGRVVHGRAVLTVNLIDHEFREGMLIYIKGGSIIQPMSFTDDFDMEAISVSDDLLQVLFNGRVPTCFIGNAGSAMIDAPQEQTNILHHIIETIWLVLHQSDMSENVIHSLLLSVLLFYENIIGRNRTAINLSTSREQKVFMHFINLVHTYGKTEHKLSFYADKLCLSQYYLGTLIREASGTTAKEWIERSVIAEAKVMLKNSDMLTYQISDILNFPNVSFFCKFFKRITGLTPLEYQRS
jgi:AraC family transcriptional activator of pobA